MEALGDDDRVCESVADLLGRQLAKAAGGRWNPEKQLWFVKFGKIAGTPLEKHIYVDARARPDNILLGDKTMSNRTAVLKKCLKEILASELNHNFYYYDGKYTFRHIDNKEESVRLIEFQPGIKSATGQFTVNLAVYSPLYYIDSPVQTLENVHSGCCFIRDRLGCVRKPNRFWSMIFGVPDKWWKQILYGPRDIWWKFSENREITEASVNECRKLINEVGLAWLEKKADPEAIKSAYNAIRNRAKK